MERLRQHIFLRLNCRIGLPGLAGTGPWAILAGVTRSFVNVTPHRSQHPDSSAAELRRSLRNRRLNPKFLYASPKQTRQWLAVHRACSAYFRLMRSRRVEIEGEPLKFSAGEAIRVFFSYRYTPDRLRRFLSDGRLIELGQWIAPSGEEGVLLFQRADS